jgi:hypothetical protein
LSLVCALLAAGAACSSGSGTESTDDRPKELTPDRTRLTWTGEASLEEQPTFETSLDQVRSRGETFAFRSALDDGYWGRNPGSVHVAIRWNEPGELAHHSTSHLFSMYVLDSSGELVASSVGTSEDISTAMSVQLESPRPGDYEVIVVPNRTSGSAYEGVVFVTRAAGRTSMPDLVPQQPTNFSFRATGGSGDRESNPSCLAIEKIGKPDLERCLRFDAVIENIGTGPFITESDISEAVDQRPQSIASGVEPDGASVQVILEPDGKERRIRTGRWVVDREHVHTHLVDLAAYELFRISGDAPDGPLVTDAKIGFCPWDLVDERFGRPKSTARRFPAQSCRVPAERDGTDPVVRTIGISAGWSDVYPARRSIQYLDATDLADGTYDVVITVDPNGWYEEGDESNNKATTRISVTGDTIRCVPEPYGCPRHFTFGS